MSSWIEFSTLLFSNWHLEWERRRILRLIHDCSNRKNILFIFLVVNILWIRYGKNNFREWLGWNPFIRDKNRKIIITIKTIVLKNNRTLNIIMVQGWTVCNISTLILYSMICLVAIWSKYTGVERFFGWDTANESTLYRKHVKQKTREVAWCCVSMAKLSNTV